MSQSQSQTPPEEEKTLFPAPILHLMPETKRMLFARLCLYVAENELRCDTDSWSKKFMKTLFHHLRLNDPVLHSGIVRMAWDDLSESDVDEMVARIFNDTFGGEAPPPPPLPPRPVIALCEDEREEEKEEKEATLELQKQHEMQSGEGTTGPLQAVLEKVKQTLSNHEDQAAKMQVLSEKEMEEAIQEAATSLLKHAEFSVNNLTRREAVMLELLLLYIGLVDAMASNEGDKAKKDNKRTKDATMLEPGEYDARSRAVLYYIARCISLPAERLRGLERWVAQRLYLAREAAAEQEKSDASTDEESENESMSSMANMTKTIREKMKHHNKRGRLWRWAATGTSVVVGAVALGVTGGLAAPMLVAGFGMLGLTWAGALATAGGLALVTSLFGVAGGGLAGYKMARRTGGLSEFAFVPITVNPEAPIIPSLHAAILVPGYLKPGTDATTPWRLASARHLSDRDVYALSYDTEVLQELGKAFKEFIAMQAAGYAAGQVLKQTALSAVMAPLATPMVLVKIGGIIDNPWGMAMDRAKKASVVLADVLQERVQGRRPVSLIGYSVGALAIFECLQLLADRGCYGLIDSVVLLGAPVSDDRKQWRKARAVTAGRLVNGYVESDWVLAFLCRVHDGQLKPAGLKPIAMPGVESVDLSHIITGHLGYRKRLDAILSAINIS